MAYNRTYTKAIFLLSATAITPVFGDETVVTKEQATEKHEILQAEDLAKKSCNAIDAEQIQQLQEQLADVQEHLLCIGDEVEQVQHEHDALFRSRQEAAEQSSNFLASIQEFSKENAIPLAGLSCSIASLIANIYFNYQLALVGRGTAIMSYGPAFVRNLKLVQQKEYEKFSALVTEEKSH